MDPTMLQLTELTLVWGPLELPDRAFSFDDNRESVIYTAEEIAKAILAVPQTRLVHEASPDWSHWQAQWSCEERTIDFDIMPWELGPEDGGRTGVLQHWGGSGFLTNCLVEDVIEVWTAIQTRCPAVWLHDTECCMYNQDSFRRALPEKLASWIR